MEKTVDFGQAIVEQDEIALVRKPIEELSPRDAEYPVAFLKQEIDRMIVNASSAADNIYHQVVKHSPMLAQAKQATQKGTRLVVDVSEKFVEDYKNGKVKLTTTNGKTCAQIQNADGTFGSKLGIKAEDFATGIDPVQMANAMQMAALQEQLELITAQINLIDSNVQQVLQGQQNDRIALYHSGVALYLEAQNITEPTMQKLILAQALRALADATSQLSLMMESDIKYLADKRYDFAKRKRNLLIDERMGSINQSFALVHQASILRAAIYCSQNEFVAMATVFDEYSKVIDTSIAQNAFLLSQCDAADDGKEDTGWKARANIKLDVADLIKRLTAPTKTIYLEFEEA